MKVILLKDVAKIGRRSDVVNVPDGFALNKLIPKNLAQAATPENLKRLQNLSQKVEHDRSLHEADFKELLAVLKNTKIEITVEANAEGRMFQALKVQEILEAVHAQTGKTLGSEQLVMKTPIKSTGDHDIELVSGSLNGVLHLVVSGKTK